MSMSKSVSVSVVPHRDVLEQQANVIRSRLVRTIDVLDKRRHQIAEIGGHVKRLAVPTALAVIGVAVATAAAAFAVTRLVRVRRERHLSYRVQKMLAPLVAEKRPSILHEAARRVTVTVLGIVAAEVAKRTAKNVLDGRLLPREAT
jgi:hypothetical protein